MKTVIVLTILLVMAASFVSQAQALTITIGDLYSTATSSYFPINCYYNYSYTQQIYTQSQIGNAGEIQKLRFNYYSGTATNSSNWVIYLGHTTRTNFPSYTSSNWIPVTAMTQVFNGTVTFPGAPGWMEVTLSTPFQYNNVDNLVLAVDENTPNSASSYVYWQGFSSALNSGIYHYSNTVNANPAAPPNAVNTNAFLSELQIVFANTEPPDPAITPYPANLATNTNVRSILTWEAGANEPTSYDVYFGTSSPPPFIGNQTTKSYNPGLMDCETPYYWQVIPKNVFGDASNCPIWSFTTWTDPTIYNFPFTEGFNATLFPPVGWVNTIVSGGQGFSRNSGTTSRPTINSSFEGTGRVGYPGYSLPGDASAWLASPEIVMQDNTVHYRVRLAFWKDSTAVVSGSLDRIELYLNTVQSLSGSPVLLGTIHRAKSQYPVETGADGWYQYSVDIGNGLSSSRYLIVKAVNATWNNFGNGMSFDNLEILEESALVPPTAPVSPRPLISAANMSIRPALSWQSGGGDPSGYRVYIGTNPEEMSLLTTQSSTSYTFGSNLFWATQYYWRVDAYNDYGVTTGTIWSFTTESVQASLTSPANSSTNIALTAILNWADVTYATGYKISVGTSPGETNVADRVDCPASQWTNPSNWLFNQSYYWKVYILNGSQEIVGAEWAFTTVSGQPLSPSPWNGQTSVSLDAVLSWTAVTNATGYLISVGTTEGATDVADRIPCTEPQWGNSAYWLFNQNYFWKVHVLNGTQEISGLSWSFTTASFTLSSPSPAHNATGVTLNTLLNWPDVAFASGYKIKVGTASGTADIADMVPCASSQWAKGSNWLYNTTYFWTVYVLNGAQEVQCAEWVFSTLGGVATNPSPANNSVNQNNMIRVLSWTAVSGATGYKVRAGSSPGANDLLSVTQGTTANCTNPSNWPWNTTVYWAVSTLNGTQEILGTEWNFTTVNYTAIPYSQDFNAGTQLPSGWSGSFSVGASHGKDGTNGLYYTTPAYFETSAYTTLLGPVTATTKLEFDYRFMSPSNYPNNQFNLIANTVLRVKISTNNGINYSQIHEINSSNHTNSTSFATCSINLSQSRLVSAGQVVKIEFLTRCVANTSFVIDIDNVKVSPVLYAPSATSPANNAGSVALDTVLDWSDVDIATGYKLSVGTSPGATDIANEVVCSESQWTFSSGWSYNQSYYWHVLASKDDTEVSSPEWNFTTLTDANNINGYSIALNGSSQSINCGNPSAFNSLSAITLEAWIYPTNFQDAAHKNTIIAKDFWGAGNNEGFAFRYGSANRTLSFVMSNGSTGWNEVTATSVLNLNTWQHVAATYNGSSMKIYVNGNQVGSLNRTGVIPPSLRNLLIGNSPAAARYLSGYIDEVRIWNIARSAQDISNDRYTELAPQPNLVAYYRMTNGNGTLLTDNSGNGNTATLTNNPIWSYEVPIISLSVPQPSITADSNPNYIRLSWAAVNGATWYAIYMLESPDGDFGIGTRAPDYVTSIVSISIPASTQSKCFFKVTAGVGNQPVK